MLDPVQAFDFDTLAHYELEKLDRMKREHLADEIALRVLGGAARDKAVAANTEPTQ